MSAHELEKLTRQNYKLQDQLKQQTLKISILENEKSMHADLARKHQKQKQFLNQQIKQLRRREEEAKYEREETENRYVTVLTKMEQELEDRRKKYHKLESKIEPLIDHDTVRLKILNEVESVHFMEIEQFKRKINQLKDQILRLKRQNQLLKHNIENEKIDRQDQIRRLKQSIEQQSKSDHLTQLSYEMCIDIENRLRANYEQARKQADYYKDKYFTTEKKYQERVGALQMDIMGLRHQIAAK